MKRGTLIVFTGVDGSGKTTQANLLVESLKKDRIKVSYVWSRWEPLLLRPLIKRWKKRKTGSVDKLNHEYSILKVRKEKLLSKPIFRWFWLTSFFIDYGLQIFIKIRIKLFKNRFIVSDRIFYDSLIDQAVNLGKRRDWLLDSLESLWLKIFFPNPDLVIYIDCPEDVAFSRGNGAEGLEYLKERRNLYLKLADRYGWFKVDGTLAVYEIASLVKDKVYKGLNIEY